MNYTKSTKLRPCVLILFSIILILNIISLNCESNVKKREKILDDLPRASDLDHYLSVLERTVDSFALYKYDLDPNLNFGLSLVAVTLNQALRENRNSLPLEVVGRLEILLLKLEETKDFFNQNFERSELLSKFGPRALIPDLVYNTSIWQIPLERFNVKLLKHTKIYNEDQLIKIYGTWVSYTKRITNFRNFNPQPEESDKCLAHLAQLPVFSPSKRAQAKCRMPAPCIKYLNKGDDFGYGLTHRLLLLLMAKHARNCAVFSKNTDMHKIDKFCSTLHAECQYNALNDFAVPDLVLEIVGLCGLQGHAQFIRNSWMETLTSYQTIDGFFNGDTRLKEHQNMDVATSLQRIRHLTGVAVTAVANVIRYIIETH